MAKSEPFAPDPAYIRRLLAGGLSADDAFAMASARAIVESIAVGYIGISIVPGTGGHLVPVLFGGVAQCDDERQRETLSRLLNELLYQIADTDFTREGQVAAGYCAEAAKLMGRIQSPN